ncbi:MAG: alpha-1,4-glucan--maltose-1-phosphate maltosyltransferase [Vicinamibacterales bacterium]
MKRSTSAQPPTAALPEDGRRRVVIDAVRPQIDGGRFAIKSTQGEHVFVEADLFADGHDTLAAVLRFRYAGPDRAIDEGWQETAMTLDENDRWRASFVVEHLGWYEYTVEGWVDEFASWRHALAARLKANQDVTSELLEGAELVRAAAARAPAGPDRRALVQSAGALSADGPAPVRAKLAVEPDLAARVSAAPDRRRSTTYERTLRIKVDRVRARVGAWYELFPRSAGPDPTRSATFAEAAARLPDIAAMGFDVLYLPPIHPIGVTHRKGRGNALVAAPADPGSPWAIGAAAGGHMAVEPGLGTLDDFRTFRTAAEQHGLEIALDLAYQSSPDHPYVTAHPEWFRHRPDGSIKYAENPPKKYQDIYPFDFDTDAWREMWVELRDIVLFWIEQGVRIFRVDNPHTKPFGFWEWMIADVQVRDPGVIFLSEAFTRPAVMKYLAKLGFTQSYTYFTWRNTKAEIESYLTELTTSEMKEYYRPNLFANTPDIMHAFLQRGGLAAFKIRLFLAATLGASYGIYSGFELGENRAVPGTEEYLDSEKYQFQRSGNRVGHVAGPEANPVPSPNIVELIAAVNTMRRHYPAFAFNEGLRFHLTSSEHMVAYSKTAPGDPRRLLVVVSVDPTMPRDGWVCASILDDVIEESALYTVRDVLTGRAYSWKGAWNYVRLDPATIPAHVLLIEREAGSSVQPPREGPKA